MESAAHRVESGARSAEPIVSVVIAAHNARRTIAGTLESVFRQTLADFEVIVVDDGSADGTSEEVASVDDERVMVVQQENAGQASARNHGIAHARGRYVGILDADDLWLPEYLELLAAALDADTAASLAYTDAWAFDERRGRFRRSPMMRPHNPTLEPPSDPSKLFRHLLHGNFVYGSTLLRRAALEQVGGFDARLRRSEDWELWLRMARAGWRFRRVEPVLAIYRLRASSLSADLDSQIASQDEMLEIVEREYDLDEEARTLVRDRRVAVREAREHVVRPPSRWPRAQLGAARRFVRLGPTYRRTLPPGVTESLVDLLAYSDLEAASRR